MKTRFTELLGIEYPIMQGGMQWLGTPDLASAVSNAGGLGTINAAIYPNADDFRGAIREMKRLTDKPFCINFSLVPDLRHDTYMMQLGIMVEEGVRIIETAGSNPAEYVPFFKEHGFLWIHKAPTVKHALKGEELGADVVTIAGFEVGGHPGRDELGSFVLVRHAVKTLKVPLLAAGGIADGAGLAAALALGASGVTMGTRFIATRECVCHDNFKNWIVNASEADTCLVQKTLRNMMRAAKNEASGKCLELEAAHASVDEILKICRGSVTDKCYKSGDVDGCIFPVGQAAGLIDDIPSVEFLFSRIKDETDESLKAINSAYLC